MAALTIAKMPAFSAPGSFGHASMRVAGGKRLRVVSLEPEFVPYPLAQAPLPRHQAARILAEDPLGHVLGPHGQETAARRRDIRPIAIELFDGDCVSAHAPELRHF